MVPTLRKSLQHVERYGATTATPSVEIRAPAAPARRPGRRENFPRGAPWVVCCKVAFGRRHAKVLMYRLNKAIIEMNETLENKAYSLVSNHDTDGDTEIMPPVAAVGTPLE